MAEQKSSSVLTAPLRGAASVLRRVPGAGTVSRAAEETLDKVGAVSPRGRRMAVYAGAGLLGVAGVVEWPVAVTGAAVAWLTQPRPDRPTEGAQPPGTGVRQPEPAHDLGTAALRTGAGGPAGSPAGAQPSGRGTGQPEAAGAPEAAHGVGAGTAKTSSGSLGPAARPDRTTL
ncbi:hypothetical protein ACIP3A_14095 [Streptomyces tricolor]|uniref:hypothetical protein n=1 Tax=Streptomyces tricolor TaxID=68277 RepID=UPI0038237FE1